MENRELYKMRCPFRTSVEIRKKITYDPNGKVDKVLENQSETFLDCYGVLCPYWNDTTATCMNTDSLI